MHTFSFLWLMTLGIICVGSGVGLFLVMTICSYGVAFQRYNLKTVDFDEEEKREVIGKIKEGEDFCLKLAMGGIGLVVVGGSIIVCLAYLCPGG